uniref:Uncharacterized protein n=1 Tax=Panagrolaimus sp. JU765 TaxID=591449 RepID=A0AC34RQM4_9BILA
MKEISEIELLPSQIFDHSVVLKREVEIFKDNFERNQRYKEFDGLIKRNHRIYEAMDCNLLPGLQSAEIKDFTAKLNKTAHRLEKMLEHRLTKNHFEGIDLSSLSAADIAKLAEMVTKKPAEMPHM